MRPLRDRLAEIMRRARIGTAGGAYQDLPEATKEDWRASADRLIAMAPASDIAILASLQPGEAA